MRDSYLHTYVHRVNTRHIFSAKRGGKPEDKENFIALIKVIKLS